MTARARLHPRPRPRLRPLAAADLLSIWEHGERRHPVQLAVELLQRALPEVTAEALWQLPLGRREALLLELRELTFGPRLRLYAACPSCREGLELELSTTELRAAGQSADVQCEAEVIELRIADYLIKYRLPTSADLLSVARMADRETALRALLARCVHAVRDDGAEACELPQEVVLAVADHMAARDPQAETLFAMTCPGCGASWQAALELSQLLLKEMLTEGERLVDEIHTLAAAYGWDEEKIVAMSAKKRRAYLARCGARHEALA